MKRKVSKFYVILTVLSLAGMVAFPLLFQEQVLGSLNPPLEVRRFKIMGDIYFDFVGGVIPTLVSLGALSYVLLKNKMTPKSYLLGLTWSTCFALIFSRIGPGAIITPYVMLDNFVALTTFIVFSYGDNVGKLLRHPIKEILNHEWVVKKDALSSLFLVGYTYSSLSVLITDLMYLPLSGFSIYIGGAGTVDGIVLSGLFIFLPLTSLVALVNSRLLV